MICCFTCTKFLLFLHLFILKQVKVESDMLFYLHKISIVFLIYTVWMMFMGTFLGIGHFDFNFVQIWFVTICFRVNSIKKWEIVGANFLFSWFKNNAFFVWNLRTKAKQNFVKVNQKMKEWKCLKTCERGSNIQMLSECIDYITYISIIYMLHCDNNWVLWGYSLFSWKCISTNMCPYKQ